MTEDETDDPADDAGQLALMPDLARARARAAKERAARAPQGPKPVDPA